MKTRKLPSPRIHGSPIVDAREWMAYRLAIYKRNLALSALLRELRLITGITQRAVAEKLGVSPSMIGAWEAGRSAMPEERQEEYRAVVDSINERKARKAA